MDFAEAIRQRIRLVPGVDEGKRHLMHPFNGRFHPIDYVALDRLVQSIVPRVDVARVDYVLGFPEGGSIPAYAFARAIGRPVILASRLPLALPERIAFEQPRANLGTTLYIYGLRPGDRALVFEDELTSGHTAVNAVRALRAAGVQIDQVAALFAIDHPALARRMRDAGITLHIAVALPPEYAPRTLDAGPE
jgi:adenine/guanine phosphoribosyltransferase-like PRPP-binding protein